MKRTSYFLTILSLFTAAVVSRLYSSQAPRQVQALPDVQSDLRKVDDQLGQASLDEFQRRNERELLEQQDRLDIEREVVLESQLEQGDDELARLQTERDEVGRSIFRSQSPQDSREQSRRLKAERVIEELSQRLEAESRDLSFLEVKLRDLENQNYDSEELRVARNAVREARDRRNQVFTDLNDARRDALSAEREYEETREWGHLQAQGDLYQEYEVRRKTLQDRQATLRGELATLQSQGELRRQRIAAIDEEQRSAQQAIASLLEVRDRLMRQLQLQSTPPGSSGPPS